MVAELAHIERSGARWRFAAGCLRVALTPQRPRSRRVAVALTVATAIFLFSLANGPGPAKAGRWIAGNLLAAAAVYGLFLAMRIATRPRLASPAPPGGAAGGDFSHPNAAQGMRLVILVGVAGALAVDAFALLRYPEVRSQGDAGLAGYLATIVVSVTVVAILAVYAWLAVVRTRARSSASAVARRYGLVGGALAGPMLVAASSAAVPVPTVLVVAAAGMCSMLAGHLASRAGGGARAGLAAGIWAGIVAGLTLFVLGAFVVFTGSTAHSATAIADFHASKFHDLRSFAVAGLFGLDGDPPLLGALVSLVFVPLLCAGLAAVGATRGDWGVGALGSLPASG